MQKTKELNEYRMYTTPAELHKAVNTLHGIVAGITTDRQISEDEINELSHWCLCHANLIDRHPFSELIPLRSSDVTTLSFRMESNKLSISSNG